MTTFNNREKGYEDKYAHDDELMFKIRARRNRLFGEWLGTEFGLSGDALKAYAADVVQSDLEEEGDDDVIRKVAADCAEHKYEMSLHRLEKKLLSFTDEAKHQVMSEA